MHEMRDRLMEQLQNAILEAEAKMMQRVSREQDRVSEMFNEFIAKFNKRLDEMQGFENALKDEQDRFEDRLK
jgi:protein subunit release factor A